MKKGICLLLVCLIGLAAGAQAEGWTISVTGPDVPVRPWEASLILFTMPEAQSVDLVLLDEDGEERFTVAKDVQAIAGQNSLYWNGTYEHQPAPEGSWRLALQTGSARAETRITVQWPSETMQASSPDQVIYTPSYSSPYAGKDHRLNYWTMPMDLTEEEAIWEVLISPITVVDIGKGEKAQLTIRSEPSEDSTGVGVVTCVTQGVHVLERGEEWSLIECYSSSFYDSKILNWNALVQGYVPTKYLKEDYPNQEMGIVVDKLTQRMYIFRDETLFTTLQVSTGKSNARQPYNETRSGEFLLTSKVGEFMSDNLYCGLAIRFNQGDLMHEVPYTLAADGSKSYANCEPRLGTKASHGCIRVQRRRTPEGVNMAWLWEHLAKNSKTRLLIWEDWQGRQIPLPEEETLLYYQPAGEEKIYHSSETCSNMTPKKRIESFTYGQLEENPYARLTRCEFCAPPLRKAEIEAINADYAPGGDHDPVLTEARKKCPRPLKK